MCARILCSVWALKNPHRYKPLPRQKTINYTNSVKFVFTKSSVRLSKTTIELNEELHMDILASMLRKLHACQIYVLNDGKGTFIPEK